MDRRAGAEGSGDAAKRADATQVTVTFDDVGPMVALPADGESPLLPGIADSSPDTQRLVDEEVRRILGDAHADVTTLLTEHRHKLDSLAHALLEHETLDGPDAHRAAGVHPLATASEKAVSGLPPQAGRT